MPNQNDAVREVEDRADEAASVAATALQKLIGEASLHSVEQKLAVLTERVTGNERAYQLNHQEMQRRLLELNHAHDKQVSDQATYIERRVFEAAMADIGRWREQINHSIGGLDSKFVSREVFDGHVKEKDIWRESVNGQLAAFAGRSQWAGSSRTLFFQILAAIFAALSLYLLFIKSGIVP